MPLKGWLVFAEHDTCFGENLRTATIHTVLELIHHLHHACLYNLDGAPQAWASELGVVHTYCSIKSFLPHLRDHARAPAAHFPRHGGTNTRRGCCRTAHFRCTEHIHPRCS